jgi:hypothetical protein
MILDIKHVIFLFSYILAPLRAKFVHKPREASNIVMKLITFKVIIVLSLFGLFGCSSKKPQYEFPAVSDLEPSNLLQNPFQKADGSLVQNKKEWDQQRDYLKAMLAFYQYGVMPPAPKDVEISKMSEKKADNDLAIEELYQLEINRNNKSVTIRFGFYRPLSHKPLPVIIKNDIFLFEPTDIKDEQKREKYRTSRRFEIDDFVKKEALDRGYIFCKFIRTDVAPDVPNSRDQSVFPLYPEYDWGTIAAWSWAYQPIINFLLDQPYVDGDKIVATGHSRGGKTALCAGVYDERITITAPNSSGTGGTGSLRYFDPEQRPQKIIANKKSFPHWWHPRFFQFINNEDKLPFDAHFAKTLIAPRALFNAHARQDFWANPYGTHLTYLAAQPVFDWLGVSDHQSIHWRDGGHNQNEEDWGALLDFCDFIFFNKKTDRIYNQNPHPQKYIFDGLIKYSHP